MLTDTHRTLLFMCGCLPLRASIAYYASTCSEKTLRVMGVIAMIASLSFFIVWAGKTRNKKGFFGGDVWWQDYRILHSALLMIFAVNAIDARKDSWKWLALDTAIGAGLFLHHKIQL